jgi:hypothetical protein
LVSAISLLVTLEIVTRNFVYRISKNLSRIHQEAVAAAQIHGGEGEAQQVLLVGNSLLLHDLDIVELNRRLWPDQMVKQFAIQSTTYFDWYYGMRRVLAEGSRPDLVVLCVEVRHIVLSSVRREVFAFYLMQRRDLLDIRRSLNLTTTETFDLLLANTSIFYALRKEMRQVLLQRLFPELPQLTEMIARSPKPPVDLSVLRTLGKDRLTAMRDLAVSSNVRFVLLLMPPIQSNASDVVRELGFETKVPVLIPLSQDGIDGSDYQMDGYHLSEYGRERFTKALVPLLKKIQRQKDFSEVKFWMGPP